MILMIPRVLMFVGGWKSASAAVGDLGGFDRLWAVDGAVEFGTAEGDGGGPAEDDDEREGDE